MCQSLLNHDPGAFIYILSMDDKTLEILSYHHLSRIQIISLNDFENNNVDLLSVKSSRTLGEYCWTITPALTLFCIEQYDLPQICYVDADLYFYNNPVILLQESIHKSILLSPHRYSQKYDQSKTAGIYCVQFMNFNNDLEALKALTWWRNACIEWCYNRIEPNRFGDQKYLDDWPNRFQSVHVLEHLGGGVAPWNVQQYQLLNEVKGDFRLQNNQKHNFDLIFYHFHGVKIFSNGIIDFGGYYLDSSIKNKIYIPYVKKILDIDNELLKQKWVDLRIYLVEICDQDKINFKTKLHDLIKKTSKTYNKISSKKLIRMFD